MMKQIQLSAILIVLLTLFTSCDAKIKNIKTATYTVDGNCGMCKKTIEKAAFAKGLAKGVWDKDKKTILLTFDSVATNADAILKRIALVGYDNEKYRATDEDYNKRPECCHYDRKPIATIVNNNTIENATTNNTTALPTEITQAKQIDTTKNKAIVDTKPSLENLFTTYFALKNALVKTDAKTAIEKAVDFKDAVNLVEIQKLSSAENTVWSKIAKQIAQDADKIKINTNVEKQRAIFATLSANMIALIKVSKQISPIYVQHCPMYNDGKGADWLSKEKEIKNPYYGSKMLNCGSVAETIK
jgi:hypothetical protein